MFRNRVKQLMPIWALAQYRAVWQKYWRRKQLAEMDPRARRLYTLSKLTSYEHIRLSVRDDEIRQRVVEAAKSINGEQWNFYSDALRPEIVAGFVKTIDSVVQEPSTSTLLDYLEIGSCQGLSMSLIGLLLASRGLQGSLVSLDPYFEEGFDEGEFSPHRNPARVQVTQNSKKRALDLYARLGLEVRLIERTSLDGLCELISAGKKFHLIYIDGSHEKFCPTVDFGLSYAALRSPGVIILDDHLWEDVEPIKLLCDRHAEKIQETWKTASYRFMR